MSQQRQAVGNTVSNLTGQRFEPQISRSRDERVTTRPTSWTSLCPKCSLENETPNHHIGNCNLYQDIRVKYFGITKITVHDVVAKCKIDKLATYLKEAGKLSEFHQQPNKTTANGAATVAMGQNEAYAMCRWTLPNGSRSASTAAQ